LPPKNNSVTPATGTACRGQDCTDESQREAGSVLTWDAVETGGEVDLASDVATRGDNVVPAGRYMEFTAVV